MIIVNQHTVWWPKAKLSLESKEWSVLGWTSSSAQVPRTEISCALTRCTQQTHICLSQTLVELRIAWDAFKKASIFRPYPQRLQLSIFQNALKHLYFLTSWRLQTSLVKNTSGFPPLCGVRRVQVSISEGVVNAVLQGVNSIWESII